MPVSMGVVERLLVLVEANGLATVLAIFFVVCFVGIVGWFMRRNTEAIKKLEEVNNKVSEQHEEFEKTLVEILDKRVVDFKQMTAEINKFNLDIMTSLRVIDSCLNMVVASKKEDTKKEEAKK